ncbi:hypothetical protein D3C73_1024810 [compost metagenome]
MRQSRERTRGIPLVVGLCHRLENTWLAAAFSRPLTAWVFTPRILAARVFASRIFTAWVLAAWVLTTRIFTAAFLRNRQIHGVSLVFERNIQERRF